MKLVQKHGVKAKLQEGLELGLASQRRDWESEVTMFGQGGEGSVAEVEWGGHGEVGALGEDSYFDSRESYIMRAFGGRLGLPTPEAFVIVAFDGSGGDSGVGVGVSTLEVRSLDALKSKTVVDASQVAELDGISSRMPARRGCGDSDNQSAEDVAGVAGVFGCLRFGGVMLIGDNLQTVTDILEVALGTEKSAREAMQHRDQTSLQSIRYTISFVTECDLSVMTHGK